MSEDPGRPLATTVLLFYALPAFAIALPTIPVFIYLPALYGVEFGIGLAVTGAILLGARLVDTFTDPLVGILSDRFGIRGNRRKPWIAVGAVIAGFGLHRLLDPPLVPDGAYLLSWSVILYAGWTLVAVPYAAWGAELSGDYHQRTRITFWREGMGLCGIVGAGLVTAVTASLGWEQRDSVAAIAWLAIGFGVVAFPLLLWRVPEGVASAGLRVCEATGRWRRGVMSLVRNRLFMRLVIAWFLNGLANGIPAALFFLYLEHALGAGPGQRPLFVLAYFVAAIAAIPLWLALSRRYGKHTTWCWAMAVACAAFAAVPLVPPAGLAGFAIICVATGAALGADLALPPAIQADIVDYDAVRTGRARAGMYFALWGMSTKLALAASVGLALPALEMAGFDPSAPAVGGKWALVVIYALIPVVIKLLAIRLVWRFPLTARKQAELKRELGQRDGQPGYEEAA